MKRSGVEFGSAPTPTNEYEIRGKKYIVTSHYVGGKDFQKVLDDLAFRQVIAEMQNSAK